MRAVLEDALLCVRKYRNARTGSGQRMFREAERWLLFENDRWPFSFERICDVLNLDPNGVRRAVGVHWGSPESYLGPVRSRMPTRD